MANSGTGLQDYRGAIAPSEWIAGIRRDRDAGQDEESQYCDAGMSGIFKDAISISKPAKLSDSTSASLLSNVNQLSKWLRAVVTKDLEFENTPEQLLARAYALSTKDPEETLKLYADWAETYDQTMLDGLAYRSPQRIATLAAVAEERRNVRVLDVGCGTGLLAKSLRTQGFSRVDGVDYSAPMLAVAQREGQIDEAFLRNLNQNLKMEVARYDMLVSTGTFTHGHVGARCLPELLALLVPGGRLICTIHRDVWDEGGFGTGLQALTDANAATVCSREADRLFTDEDEPSGWYLVLEKSSR